MTASTRARLAKVGLIGLVLVMLMGAWRLGIFARVGEPRVLAQALVEMGGWGYLAFVLAYTLLQPFGVPGTVFVIAAPLIWPWKTAFALSMIGTMAASVVGFSFARFVARDWLSRRIPARLRTYEAALARHAFRTVAILRLVFWMPQVLHSFLGVSRVPFWTHFWGSLVGYTAPLFLVSYLGARMFDSSGKMQPAAFPIMGVMAALSLLVALGARALDRREQRRSLARTGGPT